MTTWWGKQNVSSQKRAFKAANEQVLEAENYFSPKKLQNYFSYGWMEKGLTSHSTQNGPFWRRSHEL